MTRLCALTLMTAAAAGCHATFDDLRPEVDRPRPDGGLPFVPADAGTTLAPDFGARAPVDSGPTVVADGGPVASPDAGPAAAIDAASPPSDVVIARGTFAGAAGHAGAGSVELVRTAAGVVELRMGADFRVSGVPGPVVVLSERSALGTRLTSADSELGVLRSSAGAQAYAATAGAPQTGFAWVFCKPFGAEVAVADLVAVPR